MTIQNPFKDPEDKLQFAKVLDKLTAANKKHTTTFTDFLDPARCGAFLQILERYTTPIINGGHPSAERKMIAFQGQEDYTANEDSPILFPITPIAITYNQKFSKPPTHRDYLGAVLGLGLERSKIGDISLETNQAIMYAATDVAGFIVESLNQVGRVTVKAAIAQHIGETEDTGKQKRITVASMRLDGVLSAAFNISRSKAAMYIESEKVYVNWKLAKKTQTINQGDQITLRGMGRLLVEAHVGTSRKDRMVLEVVVFG